MLLAAVCCIAVFLGAWGLLLAYLINSLGRSTCIAAFNLLRKGTYERGDAALNRRSALFMHLPCCRLFKMGEANLAAPGRCGPQGGPARES